MRRLLLLTGFLVGCQEESVRKADPGGVSGDTDTGDTSAEDTSAGDTDTEDTSAGDTDTEDTSAEDTSTTDSGSDTGSEDPPPTLPSPLLGVWVDRWTFSSEADVEEIINNAADAGFNTVFFQVRGNADAYYRSSFEPWASRLSGTLGTDPGWDPLQTAITTAHGRGLQLHAWINSFPLWSGTTPPPDSTPRHALLEHPDWVVADSRGTPMPLSSGYVWMSPGNPEVRARLVDVVADIADHYEVDGVHLDLVRYPGADYSHDDASLAAFAADGGGDYAAWQRRQVVEAVAAANAAIDVPLTAAVWGIYENDWGWSGVSQGNIDYYQDSRAMITEGALDGMAPMTYWEVADTRGARLDFATLVEDFVDHSGGRPIFAGVNTELGEDASRACVESAFAEGADGVVLFDYQVMADGGWLSRILDGIAP